MCITLSIVIFVSLTIIVLTYLKKWVSITMNVKKLVNISLNKDGKKKKKNKFMLFFFIHAGSLEKGASIRPFFVKIFLFPSNICSLKLHCKIFKMLSLMFLHILPQQL